MTAVWIAVAVVVVVVYVFVFTLFAAAGRADELIEHILRETRRR